MSGHSNKQIYRHNKTKKQDTLVKYIDNNYVDLDLLNEVHIGSTEEHRYRNRDKIGFDNYDLDVNSYLRNGSISLY